MDYLETKDNSYILSERQLLALLKSKVTCNRLENAGVDNWSCFEYAIRGEDRELVDAEEEAVCYLSDYILHLKDD